MFTTRLLLPTLALLLGSSAPLSAQALVPVIKRTDQVSPINVPMLQPDAVRAANGDLIACGEMKGDILPGDKVNFVRSSDGGKTWSDVYLTMEADNPATQGVSVTGMYRRDDGAILLCRLTAEMLGDLGSRTTESFEVWESRDDGYTFTPLSELPMHPAGLNAPYLQLVEFPDGSLIMPGFVEKLGNGYWRSTDGGKSWEDFRVVWTDPPTDAKGRLDFNETSYVVLEGDRILAVARNDVDKVFYSIRSDDAGKTWSMPKALNLVGGSPAVHRLADGRLLLAYRDAGKPGLGLAVSDDDGEHWRYAYNLPEPEGVPAFYASLWQRPADDKHWQPGEGHVGYPAFIDLPDGDVYVVWHLQNQAMKTTGDLPNFGLAGTLLSATESTEAQEHHFPAAQIGTLLRAQQRTGSPAVAALLDGTQVKGVEVTPLRIENRTSPEGEVHDAADDFFYVTGGEAVFHLGGELVSPREYSPGNRAGKSVRGDVRDYRVGPGDLVVIPRGTVHRITCPDGFVEVLVIKRSD